MRTSRFFLVLLLAGVAVALACSKKSNPTQPGGGPTEPFDSGTFTSGVFVHTYNTAGSFSYHCKVHGSSMSGTVNCSTGAPDSNFVNIGPGGTNTFSPTTITVKPGGYVKWTLVSGNHSVTSP